LLLSDAEKLNRLLETQGQAFETSLQKHLESSKNTADKLLAKALVLFFIYLDEAHVLTLVKPDTLPPLRSKFHLLGRVLTKMNVRSFFVVFLSTNSWLGAFAQSTHRIPSLRDWDNTILHAPFTELPFDNFAEDSFGHLSRANPDGVLLWNVCSLEYIVKFGRPL
jgi:hypothetical protein